MRPINGCVFSIEGAPTMSWMRSCSLSGLGADVMPLDIRSSDGVKPCPCTNTGIVELLHVSYLNTSSQFRCFT